MGFVTYLILFAVCSCSVSIVDSENSTPWNSTAERDEIVYKKYLELDDAIKITVHEVVKRTMQHMMELNERVQISQLCKKNLFRLLADTHKLNLPALRISDAIARMPSGFLAGNLFQLGDYDECMSTSILFKNGSIDFKGKYCMLHVKPILPSVEPMMTPVGGHQGLKFATRNSSEVMQYIASLAHYLYYYAVKVGVCFPNGCSSKDIEALSNYVADNSLLRVTVAYCDEEYDNPTSIGKLAAIYFLLFFGFLGFVGSVTDYFYQTDSNSPTCHPVRFIKCFSVLTNFPKLIDLKNSDTSKSCLYGIRSLTVFYTIFLHQHFLLLNSSVLGHMTNASKMFTSIQEQIVINGYLTTEIFFFISGMQNSYTRNEKAKKSKSGMNGFIIMLRRLWRVYPTYAFGLLSIYLISNSHGPHRTYVNQEYVDKCDRYWWRNILFINNLFDNQEACLFHSWYIGAEMQMFLISLFTFPVFFISSKKGIVINLAVLICGLVASLLWSWYKELIPTFSSTDPEKMNLFWNSYVMTFFHVAPYFTGLFVGYFLSANKDFKISLIYQIIGWPVAGIAFTSTLFLPYIWTSDIVVPTLLESIFYLTFSKFVYTAAVAWVVVCCTRGYGGIINYILSLKVWVVISRISFMMYILAPTIQLFYLANTSSTIDFHVIVRIWQHIGDLGISALVALLMVTIIESPFIAMEKLIFNTRTSNENTENNNETPFSNNEDKNHLKVEQENNKRNSELNSTRL